MITKDCWLAGRELLVSEIGNRVTEVRNAVELNRMPHGLGLGLVVFLERRMVRVRERLSVLPQLSYPASEMGQQTLDRMVSAVIRTLRHAEADIGSAAPAPERARVRRRLDAVPV